MAADEIADAEDRLYHKLREMVASEMDEAIDTALSLLDAEQGRGDFAYSQIEGLLDDLTLDHRSVEGDTVELRLMPLLMPCPDGEENIVLSVAAVSALIEIWEPLFGAENLLYVDPRLWAPSDVYSLTYRQIAELSPAGPHESPESSSTAFGDGQVYHGLRFLAVWTIRDEGHVCPIDEILEAAEASTNGAATSNAEGPVLAAVSETETLLEALAGDPVFVGEPEDFYSARDYGMYLFSRFAARTMLAQQLQMEGYSPEGGEDTFMVCSSHGAPDPEDPDNGIVEELRISVLNRRGELLARHAIELGPWLSAGLAIDVVQDLADAFGSGSAYWLRGVIDRASDPRGVPLYFSGAQYLPEEIRDGSSEAALPGRH